MEEYPLREEEYFGWETGGAVVHVFQAYAYWISLCNKSSRAHHRSKTFPLGIRACEDCESILDDRGGDPEAGDRRKHLNWLADVSNEDLLDVSLMGSDPDSTWFEQWKDEQTRRELRQRLADWLGVE